MNNTGIVFFKVTATDSEIKDKLVAFSDFCLARYAQVEVLIAGLRAFSFYSQ